MGKLLSSLVPKDVPTIRVLKCPRMKRLYLARVMVTFNLCKLARNLGNMIKEKGSYFYRTPEHSVQGTKAAFPFFWGSSHFCTAIVLSPSVLSIEHLAQRQFPLKIGNKPPVLSRLRGQGITAIKHLSVNFLFLN